MFALDAGQQEEMMGDIVTAKSDVYSFAMILWELLTSSIPFKEFLYGPGVLSSADLYCYEVRHLSRQSVKLSPCSCQSKD